MPPNRTVPSKPRDVVRSTVACAADWQVDSGGRHHVFLFDGTWNDETGPNPADFSWDPTRQLWVSRTDPTRAFPPIITNVAKTMHALAADGPGQLTHYFRGVGNDDENDALNRLVEGGVVGEETFIRRNAYLAFLQHYRRGDRISILGFSRGAASARLFARDLRQRGLLDAVADLGRVRGDDGVGHACEVVDIPHRYIEIVIDLDQAHPAVSRRERAEVAVPIVPGFNARLKEDMRCIEPPKHAQIHLALGHPSTPPVNRTRSLKSRLHPPRMRGYSVAPHPAQLGRPWCDLLCLPFYTRGRIDACLP